MDLWFTIVWGILLVSPTAEYHVTPVHLSSRADGENLKSGASFYFLVRFVLLAHTKNCNQTYFSLAYFCILIVS